MPKIYRVRSYLLDATTYYGGLGRNLLALGLYSSLFIGIYYLLPFFYDTSTEVYFLAQRNLARCLLGVMFAHIGYLIYAKKTATKLFLKNYFFENGSAYTLAIFRILLMLILLNAYDGAYHSLSRWASLPDEARVSLPYIGWVVQHIPITPELYKGAISISIVLIYSALFGFLTRWALILLIPLSLYTWGVPTFFGKLNHNHILVWFPTILAFSRCADVLSIDSLVRRLWGRQPTIEAHYTYGLPFKFIWLLFGGIYLFAGVGKLAISGFDWALSNSMIYQIQLEWIEQYNWLPAFRIDHYPWLCKLLGLGVIFMELLYPLLILAPKTRILAALGGLSLHQGAGYFMKIGFEDLQKTYVAYINWQAIYNGFKKNKYLAIVLLKWEKMHHFAFSKFKKTVPPVYQNKPLWITGCLLVGMNTFCGILNIHSFPFSAYPNYATLVKNEVEMVKFYPKNSLNYLIPMDKYAKVLNFRKENITPFGREIATIFHRGDTALALQKTRAYWDLWQTNVSVLRHAETVEAYLETTALTPEKRHLVLKKIPLLTFTNTPPKIKKNGQIVAENGDMSTQFFCPKQVPEEAQIKALRKLWKHPPSNLAEVFDIFGVPGELSNRGWTSVLACGQIALEGRNVHQHLAVVHEVLIKVAPSFPHPVSYYLQDAEKERQYVNDTQKWACQYPEEVKLAEAYYRRAYEFWKKNK